MLAALRLVTVERGIDPRSFALLPFGGAGPLHAAALAESLGIGRVLCPRASGVLSALGLAAAAPRRDAARTVMLSGEGLTAEALDEVREALLEEADELLDEAPASARLRYELRYRGQSFELPVEEQRDGEHERLDPARLRAAFDEAHETRYSYRDEDAEIELVNIRVSVWGRAPSLRPRAHRGTGTPDTGTAPIVFGGERLQAKTIHGEPQPGLSVDGPALFALPESTLLVPPGWSASVDDQGTILMRAEGER
jgi:N-methylhydantoinase A